MGTAGSKRFTVCVEGNIGAGKSTVLAALAPDPNVVTAIPEPVSRWRSVGGRHNLLQLAYQDPSHAQASQTYVMVTQAEDFTGDTFSAPSGAGPKARVIERSIHSAWSVFTQHGTNSGAISEAGRALIGEAYHLLCTRSDMVPDLFVYLRTRPSTALQRLRARGRQEEASITIDLLEALHDLHENWLLPEGVSVSSPQGPVRCPVVTIDADRPWEMVQRDAEAIYGRFINRVPSSAPLPL